LSLVGVAGIWESQPGAANDAPTSLADGKAEKATMGFCGWLFLDENRVL
jgi:hypothetical protein